MTGTPTPTPTSTPKTTPTPTKPPSEKPTTPTPTSPAHVTGIIPVGGVNTGGGGSLRADANVSPTGANMPLAGVGFMVVLAGAGSALWAVRRRSRAGQHAAGRPRR